MYIRPIRVCNSSGLHTRPAAAIVKLASSFTENTIFFVDPQDEFNAKSIIDLMLMTGTSSTRLHMRIDGPNPEVVFSKLKRLLECDLCREDCIIRFHTFAILEGLTDPRLLTKLLLTTTEDLAFWYRSLNREVNILHFADTLLSQIMILERFDPRDFTLVINSFLHSRRGRRLVLLHSFGDTILEQCEPICVEDVNDYVLHHPDSSSSSIGRMLVRNNRKILISWARQIRNADSSEEIVTKLCTRIEALRSFNKSLFTTLLVQGLNNLEI
jgi:phosphocarrier protein